MALVFAELRATLAQTGKMLCTCLSLFFNNKHRHVDQSNMKCLCHQKSIVVATSIVYFFVASGLRRPAKENRKPNSIISARNTGVEKITSLVFARSIHVS